MILFSEVLEDIILLFVVVSMNLLSVCLSLWIGTYGFRAHLHWGSSMRIPCVIHRGLCFLLPGVPELLPAQG